MDSEALDPSANTGGHLREPVLYLTALLRAVGAKVAQHLFLSHEGSDLGQKILFPPSVFSYYSPFYRYPGNEIVAPEFQYDSAEDRARYAGIEQILAVDMAWLW